jgi:hypothetical protein
MQMAVVIANSFHPRPERESTSIRRLHSLMPNEPAER